MEPQVIAAIISGSIGAFAGISRALGNFNKKIDRKSFQNDFLILSVLRNLKILGIFTRLAKRDKKNNYLKLIPYTWKLIKLRTSGNNIFDELVSCLNNKK